MTQKKTHLHFLGIAGYAMRGLARAAQELGYTVTGTDPDAYPPGSDWLDAHRITWWREPDQKHLDGVEVVIVSGHIQPTHPELGAAQKRGVAVKSFAEFVGELAQQKRRIVVSGTHGKSTTASLITWILETAGQRPDFLIGAQPRNFGETVRITQSPLMVFEGDEYRASQLDTRSKFYYYKPSVLVITSIEMDHPDFFKNLDEITTRFSDLVSEMPKDGAIYYWAGSLSAQKAAESGTALAVPYGLGEGEWKAEGIRALPTGLSFSVVNHNHTLGEVTISQYGSHNVANALAACAVAVGEGVPFEKIQKALAEFRGVSQRLERVSADGDPIAVFDDYAHHPTEVRATIAALKEHFPGRIIAVFRPHTYSRTERLLAEYRTAFEGAGVAFITDIEGAREAALSQRVSGADIAAGKPNMRYEPEREKLVTAVVSEAKEGDTVLVMTVGGYNGLARELSEQINR